jgi:hypothetical protein
LIDIKAGELVGLGHVSIVPIQLMHAWAIATVCYGKIPPVGEYPTRVGFANWTTAPGWASIQIVSADSLKCEAVRI